MGSSDGQSVQWRWQVPVLHSQASRFSFFAITGKAKSAQAENKTKIQLEPKAVTLKENKNGNKGPEIKQESEKKKNLSTPGSEFIYCVVGLLAGFMYKRK